MQEVNVLGKKHDHQLYLKIMYGMKLYQANRHEEAIGQFLEILSEHPDSVEARYNLSIVYMKNSQFSEAIKHFTIIAKIMGDEEDAFKAEIWNYIGICHIKGKQFTEAFEALRKASEIKPGLRSQQIPYLKEMIEEASAPSPRLFQELGDYYFEMGNDFKAEEMYLKAIEENGDHIVLLYSLLQVYNRIQQKKGALPPVKQTQYIPANIAVNPSIIWMESNSQQLFEAEETVNEERKRWESYFVNGNRVLEVSWPEIAELDANLDGGGYDGILLTIQDSPLTILNMIQIFKCCSNLTNVTGKTIIIADSPDPPFSPSHKNTLLTLFRSTGWTLKETNAAGDKEPFYLVAQKAVCEVIWQSPIFNASGYSEEQTQYLDAIKPYPLKIKTIPLDPAPELDQYPADMKSYLWSLQNQPVKSPLIHYQAAPANAFSYPYAPLSIARTMFETDTLPPAWVKILNEMTEIWVPSDFNLKTFAAAGVDAERMKIIPVPLDEHKYDPNRVSPYPLNETASCKFLSVFDWSIRKGWEILLQAYFEEFREDEDVILILKVSKINEPNSNPQQKIEELARKLGIHQPPKFHIIEDTLTQEEMIRLYAAVDCFVLPSRGEGWGRPYMEAMSMELPTIGTRWSGQQAFMNDGNSYLIDIEGLVPVDPKGMPPHFHGHRWAEPSMDHLKTLMRHVFDNPEEAKRKGLDARKSLFPRFSRQNIGQQIFQRIEELVHHHYR